MLRNKNMSYHFLLPILYKQIPFQSLSEFTDSIENCYLKDNNKQHNKCLLIVTNKQANIFTECSNYIEKYTKNNKYVYVYSIPDDKIEDYDLFIKGRYSKFTPNHKLDIIKFWNQSTSDLIYNILLRTEALKQAFINKYGKDVTRWDEDAEYCLKPLITQETI